MNLHELLKNRNYQTSAWKTLWVGGVPLGAVVGRQVERPHPEPELAKDIRLDFFKEVLEESMELMRREAELKGIKRELWLAPYDKVPEGGFPDAVFMRENGGEARRRNYDGLITQFAGINGRVNGAIIDWYPASFSEWMACQEPYFTKIYREAYGWIPCAGIGVSTAFEIPLRKENGKLSQNAVWLMVQRHFFSPNYKLTLFVPGGGWGVNQSIEDAFNFENKEETPLIQGKDFDKSDMIITYIGEDSFYEGGDHARVEIGAHVRLKVGLDEIMSRIEDVDFQPENAALCTWQASKAAFTWRMAVAGANSELLASAEMTLFYGAIQRALNQLGPASALEYADQLIASLNVFERKLNYQAPDIKSV